MNPRELPMDRLATADEDGRRIWLYPADVRGFFRKRRTSLSALLIVIFLVLPWIRIGGHQALLLDIPQRRFAIFGITFWAHDAPMLFFVAGGAVLTLAFVTAIWGRVWCGWACPQTVFIDSVFRRIERWIEGDGIQRRKLDQAPYDAQKVFKKTLKWSLFVVISLIISHSFLAYFVGTEALGRMIESPPSENPASFLAMAFVTGLVLFDFGWFREQFCTLVCPYGRFQSVLMDDRSMAIMYDARRGEPRKGQAPAGMPAGDCVNCYRCVQVCPTGIDIRRGLQLECIACSSCVDACDEVMTRLKKPAGLIRYASTDEMQTGAKSAVKSNSRAWIYGGLMMACFSGLALTIRSRAEMEVELIRAAEAPYQVLPGDQGGPEILNHYKIELRNQTFDEQAVEVQVPKNMQARGVKIVVSNLEPKLAGGQSDRADLFIQFPKKMLKFGNATAQIEVIARDTRPGQSSKSYLQEVRLVGPYH